MNPNDIQVPERQRKPEIDDFFISSVKKRLIHPIVVRQTPSGPTLVVGARRLMAFKALGLKELIEGEHFRFLANLSPEEAEVVELEENVKRNDMEWRAHVNAVAKIHKLYTNRESDWSVDKTAAEISISQSRMRHLLLIARKIDSPLLKDARSIDHAYSILQIAADRAASEIVTRIGETGNRVFNPPASPSPTKLTANSPVAPTLEVKPDPKSEPPKIEDPIKCLSFNKWLADYNGPKFNLIHCDFPYNIEYARYGTSITSTSEDYKSEGFDQLLDLFTQNLDKFCSYSAHVVFWFSMEFYEATRQKLTSAGLTVHKHPLIWFKSDNSGIIPGQGNQYPRRVYETAFLCSRGARPLVKSLANTYAAPIAAASIHPSQKPEPMLRHFLSMLVDQTTDVFDPTCGSGSALRAADSLSARSILGLDIDPNYVARANALTIQAKKLRSLSL